MKKSTIRIATLTLISSMFGFGLTGDAYAANDVLTPLDSFAEANPVGGVPGGGGGAQNASPRFPCTCARSCRIYQTGSYEATFYSLGSVSGTCSRESWEFRISGDQVITGIETSIREIDPDSQSLPNEVDCIARGGEPITSGCVAD